MSERITVKQAAEITGLSQLTIREGIKRGYLEFGRSIPSKSGKYHTIHISPKKLGEYLAPKDNFNKDVNPSSAMEAKIKLLEGEIQILKGQVSELNTIIHGLLDHHEYLTKRMNGEKLKGYSSLYNSAIMSFRETSVYVDHDKVTVKRAAELLGISSTTIHSGLITGHLPFGTVTQKELYDGRYKNVYHIYANRLAEYLGVSVEKVKGELPDNNPTF